MNLRQTVAADVRRRTFFNSSSIRLLTSAATLAMKYPGDAPANLQSAFDKVWRNGGSARGADAQTVPAS